MYFEKNSIRRHTWAASNTDVPPRKRRARTSLTFSPLFLTLASCTGTYVETRDSIDVGKSRSIEVPAFCWKSEEPAPLSLRVVRRWGNYLSPRSPIPHTTAAFLLFCQLKPQTGRPSSRASSAEDPTAIRKFRELSRVYHGFALPSEISRAIDALRTLIRPLENAGPSSREYEPREIPGRYIAWRFLLCM